MSKSSENTQKDAPRKMLTSTELRARWSPAAVKKFAPVPDEEKTNPQYRCAAPMKLYYQERIEAIEQRCDFQEWRQKQEKRQSAAKMAVETKTKNTQEWAEGLDITFDSELQGLGTMKLMRLACEDYNARQWNHALERGDYEFSEVKPKSGRACHKIIVNFLRHVATNYEELLYEATGKVGQRIAYEIISRKVFEVIAQTYPFLKRECDEQLEERLKPLDDDEVEYLEWALGKSPKSNSI